MFGYTREEVVGSNLRRFVTPETRPGIKLEKPGRYDVGIVRKDGERRSFEVFAHVVEEDGQPVAWQGIARDVTEQRRAAEELRRAKEAAEDANRAKGVFLANMSHEIRTPMTAILGMTDLLLQTELDGEQRELSGLVHESASALLGILNDILDFSKIEAGRLEIAPVVFDLRGALGDTINMFQPRARAKAIHLAARVAPEVADRWVGDPYRLRQVIVNLVGNAIKFTSEGRVDVDVRGACEPDDTDAVGVGEDCLLHFAIRDTGIGIPAEKLGRIFDPFVQADGSHTRRYGGTGLGLSISVRLSELMGGRMWAESEPGLGSTFHFTVRLRRAAAAVDHAEEGASRAVLDAPAADPTPRSLRVLLVEDNAVNQALATRILQKRGHHVTSASNGAAALAAFVRQEFDVILMDVQMPVMDGFEATAAIRDRERATGGHVPIVAMTAHVMKGDEERCLRGGMDAYVAKPIDKNKLFETIDALTGDARPDSAPLDGEFPAAAVA
jgi:signal transduction histidine kinase/CheY-like chemotaxis protein